MSDIGWFTPAGAEMSEEDWQAGFAKSLGVFLNGGAIPSPNERGEPVLDDSFYLMFNSYHEPVAFTLPERKWGEKWTVVLNTADEKDLVAEQEIGPGIDAGAQLEAPPWGLLVLRRVPNPSLLIVESRIVNR